MSLAARVRDAIARRRDRFRYEVLRPQLSIADVYASLAPGTDANLHAPDGFQRLLAVHQRLTPGFLWTVTPAAAPEAVARARRRECQVLGATLNVTPGTDWHREPFHGVNWPKVHVGSCPYSVPGADLVILWHLNRMSYLIDMVSAYRATNDESIAADVYALMDSWAQANPCLVGVNWISPMETGIRLSAWSVALAGLASAPPPDNAACGRILRSVLEQTRFLASHFSAWAIPNNHLIGEATLLAAVAAYWPMLGDAPRWTEKAEAILREETRRQVLADGFQFENSVNYHLVVLDYLLMYLHARLVRGEEPDPFILEKTRTLADASLALVSPRGRMPMIGDDSMPHFIALRGFMGSPGPLSGTTTFEDFVRVEYARLFSTTDWGRALLSLSAPVTHARRFREAGIDVARNARTHLVFTHGPQHRHPFSNGHLHADAGSFELELDGVPTIVDSGTYLYDGVPGVRNHMRSARAHNTVVIDGTEPMRPAAAFQWESVVTGQALGFGAVDDVAATGCRRNLGVAEHVRVLVQVGATLIVADSIRPVGSTASHTAELFFHTTTARGVAVCEERRVRLTDAAEFTRVFEVLEPSARVEIVDDPADLLSLYSEAYAEKSTGTTIRVSAQVTHTTMLVSVLRGPEVSVTVTQSQTGQINCAVADRHVRHIVGIRLDPFAVQMGGRVITRTTKAAPASAQKRTDSLEWLDEIDT